MGIRESLERQPEEENLKNFVMPENEPEDGLEFDVEKEVMPYWSEMINELEFYRNEEDWEHFAYLAVCLSILRPDKKIELKIKDSWQKMLEELTNITTLRQRRRQACNMSILHPELRDELAHRISLNTEKTTVKNFTLWHDDHERLEFLRWAFDFLVIQPNRKTELDLDNKELFNMLISLLKKSRNEENWNLFEYIARMMFVLWPDKKKELNLDRKAWKGIRHELKKEEGRDDTSLAFADHAMSMYILSAQEVRITDQGIELIMPEKESFQPEKHKRPERRNF